MAVNTPSNTEILYRNGFFFVGSSIEAGSYVGNFSPDNLLEPTFDTDDFFRFVPNNYIALTLPVETPMEVFCIDRRHTFVVGNVIKIYLSNVSTDAADKEEPETVITILANQVGQAIYVNLSGVSYRFVRVEFEGPNPALGYQEFGWIFAGEKLVLGEGFTGRYSRKLNHILRKKESWLGNIRGQKRTEQFTVFNGVMIKVSQSEIDAIWQPLNEYAVNMWGFIYVHDNTSPERIARDTKLVQWTDADEWSAGHLISDSDDDLDMFNFSVVFRELATAGASPIA